MSDGIVLTAEQDAAITCGGKVIVSASAGSGKTFVMIEKLTRAIENGADLEEVLAVTFTKKAASNMKEKLRKSLIERLKDADARQTARIKGQIAKIPYADISTIHSLCAKLLRTYFYALDIDGGFEIIADGDAAYKELQTRALEELFEREYAANNGQFIHLLKCFYKKRRDKNLKDLLVGAYSRLRTVADYGQKLKEYPLQYTEEGFERVCSQLKAPMIPAIEALEEEITAYRDKFCAEYAAHRNIEGYKTLFGEMLAAVKALKIGHICGPIPQFTLSSKPADKTEAEKKAGAEYKAFRSAALAKFNACRIKTADRQTELEAYLNSGRTVGAFCGLLEEFDALFSEIKREENKLDYNDLEHLTLLLLGKEDILSEIKSRYKYVFVDEYQDVNPVQEKIISCFGQNVFLVGDEKQAIYGFRGSKSLFFAEKYGAYLGGGGTALRLTGNFRSCKKVIDFVNSLFGEVMRTPTCGFDYAAASEMQALAKYPADSGLAQIYLLEEPQPDPPVFGIYSVKRAAEELVSRPEHTAEGMAVLEIVEKELKSEHYDPDKKRYVPTQAGDICILVRKNKGDSTEGIIRALTDAGYPVCGAQENNVCLLPEVKTVWNILSLIDNSQQDIPLVTALLSPMGGLDEEELAQIRIASPDKFSPFRDCCRMYMTTSRDGLAQKLRAFAKKLNEYRELSDILTAGELADRILADTGLEAVYSGDGGQKLKNVLRFMAEGSDLPLNSFLARIKAGGEFVQSPAAAPSGSITVMTMHAAKGLEFPVVIIADIARTFRGQGSGEMPYDGELGFTPKCYDTEKLTVRPTLIGMLAKNRADREELINELNLFYVACTRAKCDLHIICGKKTEYSPEGALKAECYAKTFDLERVGYVTVSPKEREVCAGEMVSVTEPDPDIAIGLKENFGRPYPHMQSVDLPVKSSASAILSRLTEDDPHFADRKLFGGEGETGTERGIAYHRFLELCDFSRRDARGIEEQLGQMEASGGLTAEQRELLSADELEKILDMPVFGGLEGAELYREREFLCRLPACDVFGGDAEDGILVQGAIDLLVVRGKQVHIVDYKYSNKTDGELVKTYAPQIELYKKAAAAILKTDAAKIRGTIVNIHLCRQIEL